MTGKAAIVLVFLRKAYCYSFEEIREPTLFYKTLTGEKLTYLCNTYGLLTKREAKMAGYWPSSFFSVYRPRRSRGP